MHTFQHFIDLAGGRALHEVCADRQLRGGTQVAHRACMSTKLSRCGRRQTDAMDPRQVQVHLTNNYPNFLVGVHSPSETTNKLVKENNKWLSCSVDVPWPMCLDSSSRAAATMAATHTPTRYVQLVRLAATFFRFQFLVRALVKRGPPFAA